MLMTYEYVDCLQKPVVKPRRRAEHVALQEAGGCQSPAAPALTTTRLASGIQSSRTAHCFCSKQARQLLRKAASDGVGGDGGGGGGVRAIRL